MIHNDKIILKKIEIKSYKNFKENTISFENNLTTVVGPNDSGKTNLLECVNLFNNPERLKDTDVCYYSDEFLSHKTPKIRFYFNPKLEFLKEYNITEDLCIEIDEKQLKLITKIPPKIVYNIRLMNISPFSVIKIPLPDGKTTKQLSPNRSLTLKNVEEIVALQFGTRLKVLQERDLNWDWKKNQIDRSEEVFDLIKKNVRIGFWKYRMEDFNLPTAIPLKNLVRKNKKNSLIYSIFQKATVDINAFLDANSSLKSNLLNRINEYLSNLIRNIWTQKDISFKFEFTTGNLLSFNIIENNRSIELENRGDGFKWFLLFLLTFSEKIGNDFENNILLLDEPGNNLHPGAQIQLLHQLEEISRKNQIIFTTHSPFLVNQLYPKRIVYLQREKGSTQITVHDPRKALVDECQLFSKLGFPFSTIPNWQEIALFVEGITDQQYIKKIVLVKAYFEGEILLDFNRISVQPMGGLNNLRNYYTLAEHTKMQKFFLVDGDDAGREKQKDYKHNDFFHFLPDGNIIEDYIPMEILNESIVPLKQPGKIIGNEVFKSWQFDSKEKIDPQFEKLESIFASIPDYKEKKPRDLVRDFKFELALQVCERMNEANLPKFNLLIDLVKNINGLILKKYGRS